MNERKTVITMIDETGKKLVKLCPEHLQAQTRIVVTKQGQKPAAIWEGAYFFQRYTDWHSGFCCACKAGL